MQITINIEDTGTHVAAKLSWKEAQGLAKILEHGLASLPMNDAAGVTAANQFIRTIKKIKIPGE